MINELAQVFAKLSDGQRTSEHTNARGNLVQHADTPGIDLDRYFFDFGICGSAKGWKQFDTSQDASYFGFWVHDEDRLTFTFCEGDQTLVRCPTQESYEAELADAAEFYGPPPPMAIGIDNAGKVTAYYDERPTGKPSAEGAPS